MPFYRALLTLLCLPSIIDAQLRADELFALDKLVAVDIEMEEADWEKLRRQARTFTAALRRERGKRPYTYFKGHVTINGVRIENVGIRKKGFIGSLDNNRPSLKIKFAEYVEQAPVAGLNRLTLNNNKQDRSLACQVLAYKTFAAAGCPAPRCNLAKVSVNGRALGIYANVEAVKRPFLKRAFGNDTGDLFEGTATDLHRDEIDRLSQKSKSADLERLTQLATTLADKDAKLATIEKLVDVEAFVRFWATESLIAFWDGYALNQNNYFIYRNPKNDKYHFIPWGTDAAFTNQMPVPPFMIKYKPMHHHAVLPNRLNRFAAVQELYRKTMEELLDKVWNAEQIDADLTRIETLVADHLHESQRDCPRALKGIRSFVRARPRVIKRGMRRWPIKLRDGPRRSYYTKDLGTAEATFSTKWGNGSDSKVDFTLRLDGKSVELETVSAKAEWSAFPPPDGGPRPPTVVFTGKRKSDGMQLHFAIGFNRSDFRPTVGEPLPVMGVMVEGALGWLNPKAYRMLSGSMNLEVAGTEDGAPVRGRVKFGVAKIFGGESPPWR